MKADKWRLILIVIVFLAVCSVLSSQESDNDSVDEDPRLETLLYGIDTDVLTVLADLQREKIDRYNDVLVSVMNETRDSTIIQGIFRLWDETSYQDGLPIAHQELLKVSNDDDYEKSVILDAIAYISHQDYQDSTAELYELAESRDTSLAAAAVRAIGSMKATDFPEMLLERLREEDPVAQDDLVASLIVTLGELEYEAAADELVLIAEDAGSPASHRRFACISLGRIGRDQDYSVVERLYFEAEDATLRSYALAGLAEFTQFDSQDVLIQALKRDSYWRIRVTAAEKLAGKRSDEIENLLMYKIGSDPVTQVRIASLKTLGTFDGGKSRKFLLDFIQERRNSAELRLVCLSVLVENKVPGTVDAVSEVMGSYWEKDEGRFLEFLCRDLSRHEWKALSPLYNRMLEHPNWLLQVYGVRGIRRNNLATLLPKVNNLDRDGVDGRVRREIRTGAAIPDKSE